jgi:type II secretory pathway pseudopilin PulG
MTGMNKTNIHNKNKNNKLLVASIAIVVALALFTSPIVAMDDAFATKKKKGNHAEQSISQSQASVQNALCASGGTTFLSCNNVNFQNQKNTGNNALAQDDDDDDDDNGENFAKQSIGQSQSSEQNSQIVSGGDTIGSGNNINVRNQENYGSNVAAQS